MTFAPSQSRLSDFIDGAVLYDLIAALGLLIVVRVQAGLDGARFDPALRAMTAHAKEMRGALRRLSQIERHNYRLRRKLDMLICAPHRACVIKGLGGAAALTRWEACFARAQIRRNKNTITLAKTEPRPDPLWWQEKQAKARHHARLCAQACRHPLIFKDRVKMDFEGVFRLAPIKRGPRERPYSSVRAKPVPDAGRGANLDPIPVTPTEFRAAEMAEAEDKICVMPKRRKDFGGMRPANDNIIYERRAFSRAVPFRAALFPD